MDYKGNSTKLIKDSLQQTFDQTLIPKAAFKQLCGRFDLFSERFCVALTIYSIRTYGYFFNTRNQVKYLYRILISC